ncbi:hypothetical protein CKO44_19410 [Rubrivivax gelatinosus]|uniref:PEP-CTERM sorting domain-containing protein n=1 Tax=Rubrivivax gelatinosus TaxID=28068 RepID=UPI0019030A97|nr:hypothetical protein [Rubrivivax gelatinosus]
MATVLPATPAGAADGYRFTWLEPFGGHDLAQVTAINSRGDVVGYLYGGERGLEGAIWWHDGRRTAFGNVQALASNASGTVLLWTDQAAWTWSAGQLAPLQWNGYSRVYDMNDAGTVVGSSPLGNSMVPTRWDGGVARTLPSPGLWWSEASAINDDGLVAGYITSAAGVQRPALWRNDELIELPLPEGFWGGAWNVGSSGVAVGSIRGLLENGLTGEPRAALWDGHGLHELETVGSWSVASAISAAGLVVGGSTAQPGRGFSAMWVDGAFVDPSRFLDPARVAAGWSLVTTEDINDAGQIVGNAHDGTTGRGVGFIMTPVPEPGSCALLLAGLAVLARRRRAVLTAPAVRSERRPRGAGLKAS